jgi:fucose permease
MNDLSSVNSVLAPGDNSISQASIYAAIACAVIYAPLCVVLVANGGLIERVLTGGLGGCLFWTVIWIIGAVLIEKTGRRTARVIATGSVYGAIVGLASGYVSATFWAMFGLTLATLFRWRRLSALS